MYFPLFLSVYFPFKMSRLKWQASNWLSNQSSPWACRGGKVSHNIISVQLTVSSDSNPIPFSTTVSLSIPLKGKKNKGKTKEILHQVSGTAPAGRVTAIMGPTGKDSIKCVPSDIQSNGAGIAGLACACRNLCPAMERRDPL